MSGSSRKESQAPPAAIVYSSSAASGRGLCRMRPGSSGYWKSQPWTVSTSRYPAGSTIEVGQISTSTA